MTTLCSAYSGTAQLMTPLVSALYKLLVSFHIGDIEVFGSYAHGLFVQGHSKIDINISNKFCRQLLIYAADMKLKAANIISNVVFTGAGSPLCIEIPTRFVVFKLSFNNTPAVLSSRYLREMFHHDVLRLVVYNVKITLALLVQTYGEWLAIDSYTMSLLAINFFATAARGVTPEQHMRSFVRYLRDTLHTKVPLLTNPFSRSRCNLLKNRDAFEWTVGELAKIFAVP